jgi:hypothetical protein
LSPYLASLRLPAGKKERVYEIRERHPPETSW